MTTYDVARILTRLAHLLRAMPEQPFEELQDLTPRRREISSKHIPVALSTLVALSGFDKSQWTRFIQEYGFNIDVRPRDASRDILGKILKYLEDNPDARERLARSSTRDRAGTSPELVRALQFLLDS